MGSMVPHGTHPKTDPGSWARCRTACSGCTGEFMFLYRFRDFLPRLESAVRCPLCGSQTACVVPASAYDFVTRLLPPL
jgi:hypothetical protein